MCSVLNGGRLQTATSTKSRSSNHLVDMSEGDSNPESPPTMSLSKANDDKQDADEELSVGSPGQ